MRATTAKFGPLCPRYPYRRNMQIKI